MKKQRNSTKEALISRFITNHHNGDVMKKYMDMSPRLDEKDLHFLQSLTSNEAEYNEKFADRSEAIDIILDVKSRKKTLSEAIQILESYAKGRSSLSMGSVAVVTATICMEAVENNLIMLRNQHERKNLLQLNLSQHKDLKDLTGAVKKLVSNNLFSIGSFTQKYFEIDSIPLEVVWHFHCTDLILFTSYIYHNANQKVVIDGIKDSMVELLCSLSDVQSHGDCISAATYEGNMNLDGKLTRTNFTNYGAGTSRMEVEEETTKEESDILQLKQDMVKDLMSSLLCVAQNSSSASLKSSAELCKDILESIIKMTTDRILAASLNPMEDEKCQKDQRNYLFLLLEVPTISTDIMKSFLTFHLVMLLTYKPDVDLHTAISEQGDWTYNRSPTALTSLIQSILVGLEEESLAVMKDLIQKKEVNWRLVLVCVSAYLNCIPDSDKQLKSLVDWLLNKAFLNRSDRLLGATFLIARQCCAENCSPWFSSYLTWFGSTFGPESSWVTQTQQTFEFLVQFLTDIVPFEPPSCLKVHINKAPTCSQSNFFLLGDYIALVKTQLKDLNEAPGFGIFGPGMTTDQDIEQALKHFETHNGEIAQTLLDASLFRRQHFQQEFIGKLLTPRVIPDTPDLKAKFIAKLHSMGKISNFLFNRYQEACLAETKIVQGTLFTSSPQIIEEPIEPRDELQRCLIDLQESIKELSDQWESQKADGKIDISDLPPVVENAFVKLSHSIDRAVGSSEERELVKNKPILSTQLISGALEFKKEEWTQILDMLLDTFITCYSNVPKLYLVWPRHFVQLLQPYQSLKMALFHRLMKWCVDEIPLCSLKLKAAVALVHSIEYLGNKIFPEIKHGEENISFATYLSERLPLQDAQEMEHCFRFAVEYLSYAKAHVVNEGESSRNSSTESSTSSTNLVNKSPEVISTVPLALAKKYLYLHKRYLFSDECLMNGVEKYRPDITSPHLWIPLLNQAQMPFNEWFKQEATVKPFEDFLVCRHEYLLSELTNMPSFDSSNIIQLASEIIHATYSMDCTQDNAKDENRLSVRPWQRFRKDIMQVLSTILETYPLIIDTEPWLLNEWLSIQKDCHFANRDSSFFRMASSLPQYLLYSNSRNISPSEETVRKVADLVSSHLKDTLSDGNGFLSLALTRYLLSGLSIAVGSISTAVIHHLFSNLFDDCPALNLAARVHASSVLPILQRFSVLDATVQSTLNNLITTLAMIKSGRLQEMLMDTPRTKSWEIGLDIWLNHKHPPLELSIRKWIFFYSMLELGSQLHSGFVSFKMDKESLLFEYHSEEVMKNNFIAVLTSQLENDLSVISSLDITIQAKELPFCGLSTLSQNLTCIATVLFLLLYNELKAVNPNNFLNFESNSTLLCRVLLSCFTVWMKAGLPETSSHRTSVLSQRESKCVPSPIINLELLPGIKTRVYSILNTIASKQTVTFPKSYITNIQDQRIKNIFEKYSKNHCDTNGKVGSSRSEK